MKDKKTDLLQGTLDMLVLKALALGPLHGLGVSSRIAQITKGTFQVKPGSLFPALHRMAPAKVALGDGPGAFSQHSEGGAQAFADKKSCSQSGEEREQQRRQRRTRASSSNIPFSFVVTDSPAPQ